jgi:hypothetical protein
MGLRNAEPGSNYVPAYQVSGIPSALTLTSLVADRPIRVDFPSVTRWIIISAAESSKINAEIKIAFSEHGINGVEQDNFFILPLSSLVDTALTDGVSIVSPVIEVRCKSIWVMATTNNIAAVSILAGVTGINNSKFPILSGSVRAGQTGIG